MNRRGFLGSLVVGLLATALPAGLLTGPRGASGSDGPPSPGDGRTRAVVRLLARGKLVGEVVLAAGMRVLFHHREARIFGFDRELAPRGFSLHALGPHEYLRVPCDEAVVEIKSWIPPGHRSTETWILGDGVLDIRGVGDGLTVRWTRSTEHYASSDWGVNWERVGSIGGPHAPVVS